MTWKWVPSELKDFNYSKRSFIEIKMVKINTTNHSAVKFRAYPLEEMEAFMISSLSPTDNLDVLLCTSDN